MSPRNRVTILRFPKHRLSVYEKSVLYSVVRLFNRLPSNIRDALYSRSFGRLLFDYLVQLEPYSMGEYLNR